MLLHLRFLVRLVLLSSNRLVTVHGRVLSYQEIIPTELLVKYLYYMLSCQAIVRLSSGHRTVFRNPQISTTEIQPETPIAPNPEKEIFAKCFNKKYLDGAWIWYDGFNGC